MNACRVADWDGGMSARSNCPLARGMRHVTIINSFDAWDVTIPTPQRGVSEVRATLVCDGRNFKVADGTEN